MKDLLMAHGQLSERIRQHAISRYIRPAKDAGKLRLSIAVKDMMKELEAEDFPTDHQAQFCTAMKTKPFLQDNGLQIEKIDGPRSKRSTTVVFHYLILPEGQCNQSVIPATPCQESPSERALRLTEKLRGLMKDEIASFGGTDGFMRWVRSDEDEDKE